LKRFSGRHCLLFIEILVGKTQVKAVKEGGMQMPDIKELFQSADWKKEKHVPVIEAAAKFKKGEFTKISVCVGKEISHPNTTEHHIRWICVYFLPEGEKFPCEIGRVEFNAHGESAQGPNTSTVFTHPEAFFSFKTDKNGSILAASYCNIHGLWQSSMQITVE
jgi:superoxide reductase